MFPLIGGKRFAELGRGDLHAVLEQVEKRGVGETVRKLRQYIGAIHRYAGAKDDSVIDPTPFLREGRRDIPPVVHHAMLPMSGLGEFILRCDQYDGEAETRLALRLTLLTAARTMEVLGARWDEFSDWNKDSKIASALWHIPGARMKAGDPHMIPLSRQACGVLRQLHEITGEGVNVFPISRSTPGRRATMSNNTLLFAMYRLGYRGRATVHGFRRNFSTWANEEGWPADDIELCLAHDERNEVRGAYNAAKRLEPRRKLLQAWADFLDRARRDARIEAFLAPDQPQRDS
ncbi:MAG: tyrosine-type recombinase/integrase [Hyphomonadaceae bacterium]